MVYNVPIAFDVTTLPKSPKKRAKILGFLDYLQRKRKQQPRSCPFVNCPSTRLKRLFGNHYKRFINHLLAAGVIRELESKTPRQLEQPRYSKTGRKKGCYCTGKRDETGKFIVQPFCKAYRLITYQTREHFEAYTPDFHFEDFTNNSNPVACIQRANLKRLKVDLLALEGTPLKDEGVRLQAQLVVSSTTIGKRSNRYTHPLIQSHKELRSFIALDGQRIIEYDLKQAHPYFLLNLFRDSTEKERYRLDLEADIYLKICPFSREQGKKAFNQFAFHKIHKTNKINQDGSFKNAATQYFYKKHPIFFKDITALTGQAVSHRLSTFEASVFSEFLIPRADQLGIWCVSMYDGFAVASEDHWNTLCYLVEKELEARMGARPILVRDKCKSSASTKPNSVPALI